MAIAARPSRPAAGGHHTLPARAPARGGGTGHGGQGLRGNDHRRHPRRGRRGPRDLLRTVRRQTRLRDDGAHDLVDDLEAKVRAAYSVPGPWADRVRNALAVTLEWFSNFPAAARFTLIELAAVGPESRARFQADYSRFIRLLDDGLEDGGARPDFPQATSLAVGATIACLRGGRPRSHGRVAEAVARTHLRAARALSRRKGRQGRAAPRRCRYRPASAE